MIRLARCAPALLALAGAPLVAAEPPAPAPRLILLLVVDQGRADYFDRYRPLFTGGLARLIDESVRFLRAFHDHAIPKPGPGHATLASGTHPRCHGIIANSWIERETGEEVEAAGDRVLEPDAHEALGDRERDQPLRRLARDPHGGGDLVLGLAGDVVEPSGPRRVVQAAGRRA